MIRLRALLLIGLAAAGCDRAARAGGTAQADHPHQARVITGELAERVVVTGELRAVSSVDLGTPRTDAWQLSIRWMAEDGATVKAGERVVEFDNSAVTSQLDQKKLLLRQAEMALRSTRDVSALASADQAAEVREKGAAVEKAQILAGVPADLLPGRTVQERQLELSRAQAALATAEHDLVAHRKATALDLKVKQIELDKTARSIADATRLLDELVLEAPRDGIIQVADQPWEGRKLQIGDSTQPGWTVVSLPELGKGMEVHATLSDVDDGKLTPGMVGTCTLDAFPAAPRPCTVRTLAPVAGSESNRTLRKAFALVLTLAPGPSQQGRPGMSVKVELQRPAGGPATLVPRGAVRGTGAEARVRVPGGLRAVTLGRCDAQRCAVERGLVAGDVVELGGAP